MNLLKRIVRTAQRDKGTIEIRPRTKGYALRYKDTCVFLRAEYNDLIAALDNYSIAYSYKELKQCA